MTENVIKHIYYYYYYGSFMLSVTSFLKTKMVDFYYCSYMISWSYQKEGSSYALNDLFFFKKKVCDNIQTQTHRYTQTHSLV